MNGSDNLKPIESVEKAREMGRKGGVASGVSRRRKANLRRAMQALLTSQGTVTIDGEECTYEEALCLAMINEAISGGKNNVSAFNAIAAIIRSEDEAAERRARIRKLKAEEESIRLRTGEGSEEEAPQVVNIICDIPREDPEDSTETAQFDALGHSRRDGEEGEDVMKHGG